MFIANVNLLLATERLHDAGKERRFVHFQNTVFVASEGVLTTDFDREAGCAKTKKCNMQIADCEWVRMPENS